MSRKFNPRDPENIRQGSSITGTYQESVPRHECSADNALAASGAVFSTGVPLQTGDVVSSVTFTVGGTAALTPTAGFVALYSPAGVLLAQSADMGTTARAANTEYTVALASPQTIGVAGVYYAAISFTAATVPTAWGAVLGNAILAGAGSITNPGVRRILAQTHGAAVGAIAPPTITGATPAPRIPYVVCT